MKTHQIQYTSEIELAEKIQQFRADNPNATIENEEEIEAGLAQARRIGVSVANTGSGPSFELHYTEPEL